MSLPPLSSDRSNLLQSLGLLIIIGGYGFIVQSSPPIVIDDAFIFYRYARNITAGLGPVFNQGEFVEGFTSPLWLAILAILSYCKVDLGIGSRIATTVIGGLTVALLPYFSAWLRKERGPEKGDFIPSLILLTQLPFLVWSGIGMETMLFTLLVSLTLASEGRHAPPRIKKIQPLLVVATVWCRPEGVLVPLSLWLSKTHFRGPLRSIIVNRALAWPMVGIITLLTFRFAIYGDLLPNTYYAKHGLPLLVTLSNGFFYLHSAFVQLVFCDIQSGYLEAGVVGIAATGCLLYRSFQRSELRHVTIASLLLSAAILIEGGDWMPFGRFIVPLLPLFSVLIGELILTHLSEGGVVRRLTILVSTWWLTCKLIVVIFQISSPLSPVHQFSAQYDLTKRITNDLQNIIRDEETIALMDIGEIGYRTNVRIIDISGLVHREIAKSPGGFLRKLYPGNVVFRERPTYVYLRGGYDIDERLAADLQLGREYEPIKSWDFAPVNARLYRRKVPK